jgi:uncharacterized protein (TIGR04255 family)
VFAGRRRVDFRRPPVTETILGVQFAPLRGLSLPYLGLYWATVRSEYPTQEVKPPLAPIVEEFDRRPGLPTVSLELASEPDVRCWLIDSTSTQLIQIQRDRFIRNWRKGEPPHDRYPRYDDLKPRFESDWSGFLAFLEREGLGTPEVNQCEVTYINHIPLGDGYHSLGSLHEVLSILGAPVRRDVLPEPEVFVFNTRYVLPGNRGRLHVSAQPAVRRQDLRTVLQLTLLARGAPRSSSTDDILAWFDEGHDWIVHGFKEMTTLSMHEVWGVE